ncbi:TIGR01777 family oxidoreductase [Umezawaea sp. Da 62-37]|uniref:TIGR01777 family oxidoreductase n=1 Tax=Umezawaea sp. Da 62-37 TaxID=3075927 RepID=UPI0028F6C806|nr:TIGR01777 family oxidoreductase [Umezawaea sp. Da 62-37]WNV86334.1 TIGR01777 family oxidoreductase [Umezawaea sp. Da 62-37]
MEHDARKITVSGASGLIGAHLVARLRERGDEVSVLSRSANPDLSTWQWDPLDGPAPAEALAGRDAVVHLAGEPIGQRLTDEVKDRVRRSRVVGTRNLVEGLRAIPEADRPKVLVSSSGVAYYGPRGDEEITESTPAGDTFLARVSAEWEQEAARAADFGVRVVRMRTGVVLDASGGTLKSLLATYRAGMGGPIAGGAFAVPWIHVDDIVGLYVKAVDDASWSGAYNGTAPEPVTQKEFSKALGRALRRPAVLPTPGFALKVMLGEMADMVTTGQRAVPRRALDGGYTYAHPDLDAALADALR